jgi:hypothetical protein
MKDILTEIVFTDFKIVKRRMQSYKLLMISEAGHRILTSKAYMIEKVRSLRATGCYWYFPKLVGLVPRTRYIKHLVNERNEILRAGTECMVWRTTYSPSYGIVEWYNGTRTHA